MEQKVRIVIAWERGGREVKGKERLQRGMQKLLVVMDMLIILIMVAVL